MKIMFFMESYYCGGVDTFVINLINNWPKHSDELILVCNETHAGLDSIQSKIRRPCVIIRNKTAIFTSFFNKIKKMSPMDKFKYFVLKALSPLLRYAFLAHNIIVLRKMFLKNNPERLMIINGGYPGGDSCRAAAITWGLLCKKGHSIHNFHGVVVRPGWHIALQEYIIDLLVARFSRIFVTVSETAAKLMIYRRPIYENRDVLYIHSGINLDEEKSVYSDIKNQIHIPITSPLCLMIGNYNYNRNYDKGHVFLFQVVRRVLRQVPTAQLLICGHGSEEDMRKVYELALGLSIEQNIHLSGFRDDIPSILKMSDVLLISAQAFESFGLVAVEAMAHKLPIVATRVGGIPEVVIDGKGGYCFEKEDIDAYSRCVVRLLKDEELKKEQGEKGFQRYNEFFTAQRMAKKYADLIYNE